jgi:hypothetical protein
MPRQSLEEVSGEDIPAGEQLTVREKATIHGTAQFKMRARGVTNTLNCSISFQLAIRLSTLVILTTTE